MPIFQLHLPKIRTLALEACPSSVWLRNSKGATTTNVRHIENACDLEGRKLDCNRSEGRGDEGNLEDGRDLEGREIVAALRPNASRNVVALHPGAASGLVAQRLRVNKR